ncbi:MAG: UDP-N-acetylmuramoyl-tripeptide--D-alanyl-D-alanine ligase [Rhodobacteraceae bacterium]|nr:UDP-N-acetylmuramoyl-tripeptide--D-alanyl-D-alanine ligase [Paracoccaceae bacterium]
MTLWRSSDAERACGGVSTRAWAATGVSIDTRSLAAGDLFVALTDRRDGHDFLAPAFEAGAAAGLVSHIPETAPPELPLLVVPDVLQALERLGVAARRRMNGKIIAVTGSVGKTSTKEMLRLVLSRQGRTHAAEHSYNNHWGVPLTLARMPPDTEYAVIEIGMSHAGEIEPLSRLVRPDIGMITEIAPAHLAAFDSIAEIAEEKAAIFAGMDPGGCAVLNADTEMFGILRAGAKRAQAHIVTFGGNASARFRLEEARMTENGTVIRFSGDAGPQCAMLGTHGDHFARNAVGVFAAVSALEADVTIASLDIRHWTPPPGRGAESEIILDEEKPPLRLIDDAFNANPASLQAALELLAARPAAGSDGTQRKIAILGDMLELGSGEAVMHRDVAALPAIGYLTKLHCAGALMRHLYDRLPSDRRGIWRATSDELAAEVKRLVAPGDLILVKGSKSSRVSVIADAIRRLGIEAPEEVV